MVRVVLVLLAFAWAAQASIHAQTPSASLNIVVTDPSGGVIVGARVSAVQPSAPSALLTGLTGADGTVSFPSVLPGRYTLRAEFAGFDPTEISAFRIRAGANRRVLVLSIRRVEEALSVGRDRQDDALDPRGNAFSTILTREQIDALPDDPAELEAVLQAMSPPGARLRVDGFSGGRLPPKSQIRSIRLPRLDQFAAQNHGGMGGAMFIDISTHPGGGVVGGSVETTWRDDAMNASNPFVQTKGSEYLRRGGLSFGGPIVPNRSSFNVDYGTTRQLDAGIVVAALPAGQQSAATGVRSDYSTFGGRVDQMAGAQLVQASVRSVGSSQRGLGIGAYDLPGRGYSIANRETTLRAAHNGPIGRATYLESRLQAIWSSSTVRSDLEGPTIRVIDAFTTGGAQRSGERRALTFESAFDVDHVRGAHSIRAGVLLEGGRYRSDQQSNYHGTFIFSSLAAYDAARPSLFTRRSGEPLVQYTNLQVGAYAQDDYRVSRSLLLSYGLRYEGQSIGGDWTNVTPRATLAWAPSRSGRTTVRAAWGVFSDWFDVPVYEQALRLDGQKQQELIVVDPGFPDPGEDGQTAPSHYLIDGAAVLPRTRSWSVGVDHALTSALRISLSYTERATQHLLRGVNDNAPLDGVRPDPAFLDVIRATDDAAQSTRLAAVSVTLARPEWRRLFVGANYTLGSTRSNTTGAYALPATGDIGREWGEVVPRHRFGGNMTVRLLPALSLALNARAQSGAPYDVTTGFDSNSDGQFSDRPAAVERNSARSAAHWDVGGRLSYAVGFGGPARGGPGGGDQVSIRIGRGGGMEGGYDGGAEDSRYRVEFYVSAQNLTNRRNYIGYSGVMTSPFFLQPTDVLNPRKFEIGVRFGF